MAAKSWNDIKSDYPTLGEEIDEIYPPHPDMDHRTAQTLYHSFNVPERHLNGEIYVWFHPTLGSVSAGLWVTRGFKRSMLETDYFDWRAYMPHPTGALADMYIGQGLHFRTLEPLTRFTFDYADEARRFAVELSISAVTPPIARSNIFDFEKAHHGQNYPQGGFEQLMHTSGILTLEGERISVDCLSIRDRSWGQTRDEAPRAIPPVTWTTGIVDEDFAFMVMSYDDPQYAPEVCRHFNMPLPGKGLVKGWVWRDGEIRSIVSAKKSTMRVDSIPQGHHLEFEDTTGRVFDAEGICRSSMPFHGWPNLTCRWGLTEWQIGGRKAWGETQDAQWNDYVRLFGSHA